MFAWLIAWSLGHARTVLVLAVVVVAAAIAVLPRLPIDVFPELNAPTVVIMTEAGGLAADEVEQQVSVPLESAVNGLPGLRALRSSSALGLSIIWCEFSWGEDLWRARQMVAERLAAVIPVLPPGAHAEISPVTSITGEILLIAVTPTGPEPATPMALRSWAEYELTNHLLGVPGVAQVVALGGELPEYQVLCRQDRLRLYGLTVAQVAEAAGGAHSTASAGFLPLVQGRELPLRQTAQVHSLDDLRATLVTMHEGVPVTIGDVAEVALAPAESRGAASANGRTAVILSVQKSPGTNTLVLTTAIEQALSRLAVPSGMAVDARVFRQADFIKRSIDTLRSVLIEAVVIVAVVLMLFLLNVRTTLITLTALPLSLAVAVLVFAATGQGLNVMTIGGLAVALGGLVDDAIIDVENVFRRLCGLPSGSTLAVRAATVECASNEIRAPMVFATVIIVLVFVPLLFLQGMEGRFFRPLGLSYIIATLASLVVAVTVTPALCRLLLAVLPGLADHGDGRLVLALKRWYRPVLATALAWKRTVVLTSGAVALAALGVATTFGSSFLPSFNEGTFQIQVMAPPGTALAESDRLVRGLEMRIAAIDGVVVVARRTGRAERDQHAEPPSASEINVTLSPGKEAAVRAQVDALLAQMPGLTTSVGQPIEHRLSHILSGTPAAVAITVYGEDLDALRSMAQRIQTAAQSVPGTRDVVANREVLIDTLPIRYRHDDLARAGLSPVEAAHQVGAALGGVHVATISEGIRRRDLTVRLHPDERQTPAQAGELILTSPHGPTVRLREVADLGEVQASNLIARQGGRRKAVVSCNVQADDNLGDVVQRLRTVIDPLVAEAGLTVQYGGQFEAQQEASRTIAIMGLAVVVVVFLLLAAALGSPRSAGVVLLNLPLALIGGIAAILLTEGRNPVLSIASLVGFITLFGIAVRNGILLVNQYQALSAQPLQEAILRGSEERLVAILMTALCAAIGLVPLALMQGEPGAELLAPLAIVVLGGLLSSTFLNLIVVPAAYAWSHGSDRTKDHP